MPLLPHQVKFAKGYPDKAFVVHEGGTGKSVCGAVWLHDNRDSDALVICPKRIVEKWKETLKKWETKATVLSKETFKKTPIKKWSAVVCDESDEFASPLFLKGRSQLSESLYKLVQAYPDMPIMLATATPVRSSPWNLHSLLCFSGSYYDWKEWREAFFNLESRPYIKWKAWFPKPDWRTKMRPILESHADIVLLKDCVDVLPPVTETIVKTPYREFPGSEELHPTARFVEEHQWEQRGKIKYILEVAKGFRKVIVVAYYVEQLKALGKELEKDRKTYVVYGGTKGQEEILKEANEVDECFLVVQASLGIGWDANTFSCVIFTSMSYKMRDFVQMKYRIRRINDLHPVHYFYLQGGRCDRQVYKTIQAGKDFIPSEWGE